MFHPCFQVCKGVGGRGIVGFKESAEGELVLLLFLSLSPCRQKIFQASFPFLPYFCVPKAPVPPVTNFRVIEEGLFSLKVAWTPPLGKLEGYKIYIPRGEFYSLLIHFINLIQFFLFFLNFSWHFFKRSSGPRTGKVLLTPGMTLEKVQDRFFQILWLIQDKVFGRTML